MVKNPPVSAAAAAARSFQSCPTLRNRPHRWQPIRLPRPWDFPGKNTGVGCHFLLQCMKVKSESEVTQLCPTLRNPWTAGYQAPLSMGFPRQEYWSGLPLPDVKDTGLIPGSGRLPKGGHGNPLHYSCLDKPMDRKAWRSTAHKVTVGRD